MKNLILYTGHELKFNNIVRAENCTLYDAEGNKYLDLESGVWCTSVGHCNPKITKIIKKQADSIIHSGYCYLNPVTSKAAEKLLKITGINKGKCIFACSGSEACEFAVKAVMSFKEPPYILTMKDSYHGAYGSVFSKEKDNWFLFDWQTDNIKNIPFNKITAFMFEPGSSSGLVRFPPKELIQKFVENIKKNNGTIIANEITTGIGRTGEWFGYNHYNIIPDIVAVGKGVGNGYPVSCTILSDRVIKKMDMTKFHHQSHQNDPLGAAVAYEVLNTIENDNLIERGKRIGNILKTGLNEIKDKYGIIKEVRGRGMMIAVEFIKNDKISYAEIIRDELYKRNIILVKRPGFEVFRIDPALTIEDKDVKYFLKTFEEIVSLM